MSLSLDVPANRRARYERRARLLAACTKRGESGRDVRSAREWVVHVAPGQAVRATAERVIGGRAQCQQAAGVLLTIAPDETGPFSAAPAKYFVAEPNPAAGGARAAADTRVAAIQNATLTTPQARQLETLLGDLLNRELPAIRDESAPDIARMMSSDVDYHRAWATARRAAEDELMRGSARLVYDVQGYRLDPRGGTMYFVRAQWHAGGRQAFAAAVWLRGDPLELVEADTSAASWLRMFEFQGRVYTVNLGQVLNVIDRQGDGWGEIIFARGGYESLSLSVRRYSADGFRPEPITFTSGC